ncbi:MAG: PilZ domain-containing protein [Candidatus Hydrogenedentes bacterium]|nr:PilZ domain-containing protein [Candidatus Hydrogenedentota bacterium]
MRLSTTLQNQLARFDGRIVDLFGDSDGNAGVRTMDQKTNERRHERFAVPVAAWIEFYGDAVTRGTVSRDVSAEGARFSSVRPAAAGEPVIVRMQLGRGAQSIECKGRVVWTKQMPNRLHDFGVRFIDLTEDERFDLVGHLNTRTNTPAYAAV